MRKVLASDQKDRSSRIGVQAHARRHQTFRPRARAASPKRGRRESICARSSGASVRTVDEANSRVLCAQREDVPLGSKRHVLRQRRRKRKQRADCEW
eukprot:2346997-Pleurochrysis_carterae.AAC.1